MFLLFIIIVLLACSCFEIVSLEHSRAKKGEFIAAICKEVYEIFNRIPDIIKENLEDEFKYGGIYFLIAIFVITLILSILLPIIW